MSLDDQGIARDFCVAGEIPSLLESLRVDADINGDYSADSFFEEIKEWTFIGMLSKDRNVRTWAQQILLMKYGESVRGARVMDNQIMLLLRNKDHEEKLVYVGDLPGAYIGRAERIEQFVLCD